MWYNDCFRGSSYFTCNIFLKLEVKSACQPARFVGPTWGLPGTDRTQVGPMLAPWTLLLGPRLPSNPGTGNTMQWGLRMVPINKPMWAWVFSSHLSHLLGRLCVSVLCDHMFICAFMPTKTYFIFTVGNLCIVWRARSFWMFSGGAGVNHNTQRHPQFCVTVRFSLCVLCVCVWC